MRVGWMWSISMLVTALLSFDIRVINDGQFSLIHLLSVWTIGQVSVLIWRARSHKVALHRKTARGFVAGALLVAGFFTFPFGRLLGNWLFA
jgi:uncharacterized membrane protein